MKTRLPVALLVAAIALTDQTVGMLNASGCFWAVSDSTIKVECHPTPTPSPMPAPDANL